MRRVLLWLPLLAFATVLALAGAGMLWPKDTTIRSRLVGQLLPDFDLAAAIPTKPGVETTRFQTGKPRLLNIFGSWCVPCAAEAPQLMQLARAGAQIDAIAIRDRPGDIVEFLTRYGDPYTAIGDDRGSSVQLALGSSGVPETFVIGGDGRIVLQHIGPIRDEDVPTILTALADAR